MCNFSLQGSFNSTQFIYSVTVVSQALCIPITPTYEEIETGREANAQSVKAYYIKSHI